MPINTSIAKVLRSSRRPAILATCVLTTAAFVAPAAAAAAPRFQGASADAKTVFFDTDEALVPGDTDSKEDVYQRSFDQALGVYVTREASTGPSGGNDAFDATYRGNSENGGTVFFSTVESLVPADEDRSEDVYAHLASGATVLLTGSDPSCTTPNCGNGAAEASFLGATANGSRVFFATGESLTAADGDNSFDVYARTLATDSTVLVSQAGTPCGLGCGNGPLPVNFAGASADGSKVFLTTAEALLAGDVNGVQDIYERDLSAPATTLVPTHGTCPGALDCTPVYRGASQSGDRVFFQTLGQLGSGDEDEASDVYVWSGGSAQIVSKGDPSCAASHCGNGTQPATFVGSSAGGDEVFFETAEALTSADKDGATDVYARDLTEGTTSLVSTPGTCPAAQGCNADYVGASGDGNEVFFQTDERAALADTDSSTDVYERDLALESTSLVSAAGAGCSPGCGNGELDARFSGSTPDGAIAFFSTAESLSAADEDESVDVYARDASGAPVTTRASSSGVCPLNEEKGCDASFDAAAADGSRVVFSSAKRLSAEDGDSELDIFAREEGKTRLVSAGNSIVLGPETPILNRTDPASPNSSTTPALIGSAGASTLIKIYTTSNCSGPPAKTGSSEQLAVGGIPVPVASGSTTVFRATATDAGGITSGCSATAVSYTQASDAGGGGGGDGGGGDGEAGGGGGGVSGSTATAPAVTGLPTKTSGRGAAGVGAGHVVPQTRITFAPASKTRSRRPVFRFADSTEQDGTTFRCRVDRHPWQGCSSPLRLKPLALGSHVFAVKGSNSGLVEANPVVRKFKVVGR